MTATVRIVIEKPHDIVARLRVVSVNDGAVQSEQVFGAGYCEVMSDPVTLHAGVQIIVDELLGDVVEVSSTAELPDVEVTQTAGKRKRGK